MTGLGVYCHGVLWQLTYKAQLLCGWQIVNGPAIKLRPVGMAADCSCCAFGCASGVGHQEGRGLFIFLL